MVGPRARRQRVPGLQFETVDAVLSDLPASALTHAASVIEQSAHHAVRASKAWTHVPLARMHAHLLEGLLERSRGSEHEAPIALATATSYADLATALSKSGKHFGWDTDAGRKAYAWLQFANARASVVRLDAAQLRSFTRSR